MVLTDRTIRNLIVDGWEELITEDFINKQVTSIPSRLLAVKEGDGQMTGY